MSMSDVILSIEEYEALKAVHRCATELVTNIPYINMAGGNITRQNISVQALSTALETARVVDFENVRTLATGGYITSQDGLANIDTSPAYTLPAGVLTPEQIDAMGLEVNYDALTVKGAKDALANKRRTRTTKG